MSTTFRYGAGQLHMVNVLEYDRRPVYHGPTYLYTEYRVAVSGVFNPWATAYTGQAGTLTPTYQRGDDSTPALTDVAVRHLFAQPRQTLLFMVGTDVVLKSPKDGETTDAANGPFPEVFNVVEILGTKTFLVSMAVTVRATEATSRVVLSHRWESSETIELPHYQTVRTVRGEVVFNTARLLAASLRPDNFRQAVVQPCPRGYQRQGLQVSASEDGTRLFYEFQDRQVDFALAVRPRGMTKMEAFHTAEIRRIPFDQAVTAMASAGMRSLGRIAAGGLAGAGLMALGGIAVANWVGVNWIQGAWAGAMPDVALTYANIVPRAVHSLMVRAYGDSTANRKQMERACYDVCVSRLNAANINIVLGVGGMGGLWFRFTHNIMDNFVEVQVEYAQGIEVVFGGGGVPGGVGFAGFEISNDIMPDRQDVNLNNIRILPTFGVASPAPGGAGGVRATNALGVLAQVLQDAGNLPAALAPAAPQNEQNALQ